MWADKFDESGDDLFDLQDRVTRKIVTTLGGAYGQIRKNEYQRVWSQPASSLDEYDCFLRGHSIFYGFTAEAMKESRAIWSEGLTRFPNSGLLKIKIAWTLIFDAMYSFTPDPVGALTEAFALSEEGLVDKNLPQAGQRYGLWQRAALLLWLKRDHANALRVAKSVCQMFPFDGEGLGMMAQIANYCGDLGLAKDWMNESMVRDPHLPEMALKNFGVVSYSLDNFEGHGLHLIFFMIPDEIVSITIEGRDIAVTTPSITRDGDRITIQVEVTLSGSMLACEESILDAPNEAGSTATREALQRFDTDGARLELGGQPWFSQGRQPKYYQTPYGEVEIERHVYQRSHGGKTFCPLERDGRIVVTSTPRFAKVISHKFSTGSSTAVRTDLMDNHARTVARSYLQRVAEAVGAVAQAKEESWSYATPRIHGEVASVAIGLDGTCKLLCEQGWREAMTGTISLYDGEGERLHTIYLGATPEYGKGRFVARLEGEIAHVRSLYPSATYVGVADGAQCNWDILSGHTDEQILDFYHASGYVGDAAKAAYPGDESERARWIRERCHALKHRQGAASRILKQMRAIDTRGLSAERRDKLDAAITYFANHKHQMHYSRYRKQSLPMGSGVTEAACKTLIKQRLCQSGMRWKDKGAGIVLSLRSLMLTRGRWQQFWAKLDQYGMPALR